MKKCSEYPETLRAYLFGALITLSGGILIIVFSNMILFPEKRTPVKINKIQKKTDSAYITEKVKSYYKLDKLKITKLDRLDLANNGTNNEFVIVYQLVDKNSTSFYDIFTIRDSSIHNLYHEKYFPDLQKYDFFKGENRYYFLKMWKDGSGSYLSLEIYIYSTPAGLTKIYSFPDNLDTFQGYYIRIDNKMYFVLSDKRYNLVIDTNDKVNLVPYNKRLNISDLRDSEHILRFDEKNSQLIIVFDNKSIGFERSGAQDTVLLYLNDTCWIDNNSLIPTGLRYFQDPHFENHSGLFDYFIAKKTGKFSYDFINEGYGGRYNIHFKILDRNKNFK